MVERQEEGRPAVQADDKGKLFFDPDGKGGTGWTLFAKLDKHLDLTHHAFVVVAQA
jgi:hypothetical protein